MAMPPCTSGSRRSSSHSAELTQQDLPEPLKALVPAIRKRLATRQPQIEQRRQALQFQRLAVLQDQASWSLLADAAVGQLNPRALTELQIAWNAPETSKMLDEDRFALLLTRSLWAVKQSAAALPDAESLQDLARLAEGLSHGMMQRTASRLQQPADEGLLWTAILTRLIRTDVISADAVLRAAEALPGASSTTGADVLTGGAGPAPAARRASALRTRKRLAGHRAASRDGRADCAGLPAGGRGCLERVSCQCAGLAGAAALAWRAGRPGQPPATGDLLTTHTADRVFWPGARTGTIGNCGMAVCQLKEKTESRLSG